MNKLLKFLLPIGFFVTMIIVLVVLFLARPQAQTRPVEIKEPLVSVTELSPQNVNIPVFTRGTVTPGTEITLQSEVNGTVTFVSENFAHGGVFRKGEVLVRVDGVEAEIQVKEASAGVAQALQMLKQAEAERAVRSASKGVSDNGRALFNSHYEQARASYDAARAKLEAINMQKRKTVITAPFDGRVRVSQVNIGQFLHAGMPLGSIYAMNAAEVRLPLADSQLAMVNVPLSVGADAAASPRVLLTRDFGGRKFHWVGQVVRSEAGVDEYNRLQYLIAQIPDPFALDPAQPDRPPLTSGNFVDAQVDGRAYQNVFLVPRRALRNGAQVWTVTGDSRLKRRDVDILYKGKDIVYVRAGLEPGERVVLSQLDIAVDGMKVRVHLEDGGMPASDGRTDDLMGQAAAPTSAPTTQASTSKPAPAVAAEQGKQLDKLNNILRNASPQQQAAAIEAAKSLASALKPEATADDRKAAAKKASSLADMINETETAMTKETPKKSEPVPVSTTSGAIARAPAPQSQTIEAAPSVPSVAPASAPVVAPVPVAAPRVLSESAQ